MPCAHESEVIECFRCEGQICENCRVIVWLPVVGMGDGIEGMGEFDFCQKCSKEYEEGARCCIEDIK